MDGQNLSSVETHFPSLLTAKTILAKATNSISPNTDIEQNTHILQTTNTNFPRSDPFDITILKKASGLEHASIVDPSVYLSIPFFFSIIINNKKGIDRNNLKQLKHDINA